MSAPPAAAAAATASAPAGEAKVRVTVLMEGVRVGLGRHNGGEQVMAPAAELPALLRAGQARVAQLFVRVRALRNVSHDNSTVPEGAEFLVFPENLLGLLDAGAVEITDAGEPAR